MSLTREDRVRILCSTLLDYLPGPKTWSGQLARSANPRPVTQDVAPCTLCLGRGRLRHGRACLICPSKIRYQGTPGRVDHACYQCDVCDGSGWRKRRRGEEPHDPMTGLSSSELAVAADAPAPIQRRSHEANLGEESDPLERSRRARDRSGSYRELERCLEILRDREPWLYELVWHVLVCGEPIVLSPAAQAGLENGIVWLAREMRQARVPRSLLDTQERRDAKKVSLWRGRAPGHEKQRGQRNAEISEAYVAGEKVSKLAERYGITREHVHRIVRGERDQVRGVHDPAVPDEAGSRRRDRSLGDHADSQDDPSAREREQDGVPALRGAA